MSSEEVAELAQAIHNHADVLYESWKKGQDALNMKRMESTLELLADPGLTPKLEQLVSTFVRKDKEKRQIHHFPDGDDHDILRRESSPIGGGPRKSLPKSILAVVQRFESQQQHQSSPSRERSPAIGIGENNLVRMGIPGVGPVTKNVLWTDSVHKHAHTERERTTSPTPTPINIKTYLDSNLVNQMQKSENGLRALSPTGKVVRERNIPIERSDNENNNVRNLTPNRFSPIRSVIMDNKKNNSTSLEEEEEKLLRALHSGHPPSKDKQNGTHEKSETTNHYNPRVTFAKERFRQSQENPLTQQRLDIQRRLPFPNGNLAAAIALQQGKQKFQPNNNHDDVDSNGVNGYHQNNHSHRESSRNNFVRFGPGATVADRVQLFEKYPTHISALQGLVQGSKSPPPGRTHTPGHVITHPIHIQHSNEPHPPHSPQPSQVRTLGHPEGHISNAFGKTQQSHPQNGSNGVIVNGTATAPWRTSPAREITHLVQTSEPSLGTSPVRKVGGSAPLTSSATNLNRRLSDKAQSGNKAVPKFFFPDGKPTSNINVQQSLSKAEEKLRQEGNCVNYNKFGEILVACGIPLYWKKPFWMALCLTPEAVCTSKIFLPFLRYLFTECQDEAARFVRIMSSATKNFPPGHDHKNSNNNNNNNNSNMNAKYYSHHGNYCTPLKRVEISMSDFLPMLQDIIDTHPGLGFLRDAPEFHSRYITTVISRIFYKANRSWSGRLTLAEIRRSNLLPTMKRLEEETDINSITEYFSYEHFYVIYCKFWELDKDHDLLIDKHDLAAHADRALSSRIIDRIFSGTVLRGWDVTNPTKATSDKMTYSDFVWFLLSEEDKKTATAIEYWFRCLDLDGDGIISPYELQHFYSEQESRIESLGIEPLHFSNVYCQIVDMLHCPPTGIHLHDLKKNPHLAANVFNTVFNLDKYLEHEQRDPFAAAANLGNGENGEGDSDWDKYAAQEYELLIAEESPADQLNDSGLEEPFTP